MPLLERSLFIFRRDLRLEDNTALMAALASSREVLPCFIFDPRQVVDNEYKSDHAVRFMIESLEDLDGQLQRAGGRLYVFFGEAERIVEQVVLQEKVRAVFVNRDYTPFSVRRDLGIQHACEKHQVVFRSMDDSLFFPPERIGKNDGGAYTVYGAFLRKVSPLEVPRPVRNRHKNYVSFKSRLENRDAMVRLKTPSAAIAAVRGGRGEALKILRNIGTFRRYDRERDIPSVEGTTRLSPHNKFGTCSVREVYWKVRDELGAEHTLIRELFWREFFTYVGFHHPYVLGEPFHRKYARLPWSNDAGQFKAWCEGRTGFPIVDAGMRELNATGLMHNRARMITASFLVKDLHIDWRWGEKYFARKLVDYDPLVNNGNWQWAASTGCDAQPYFRIFNPWLQQKRFDPECVYIKRWVPELSGMPAKEIHALADSGMGRPVTYPVPTVEHRAAADKAKAMFRGAR